MPQPDSFVRTVFRCTPSRRAARLTFQPVPSSTLRGIPDRWSQPRNSRQSASHIIADSFRLSVSTRSLWPWNITGYSVYGMRSD